MNIIFTLICCAVAATLIAYGIDRINIFWQEEK